MSRKKWSAHTEITPSLLKSREKRKWQVALRRYVLEKHSGAYYAPYFGLDIENLRNWFELQFGEGTGWNNFGEKWQFAHVIPVSYFDFSLEKELSLAWNFINLRVEHLIGSENNDPTLSGAKKYFLELYESTHFEKSWLLYNKILEIEETQVIPTIRQQAFILDKLGYLTQIKQYAASEFQLLNNGKSIHEIEEEMSFLKKFI